jgi:hypothetical protein
VLLGESPSCGVVKRIGLLADGLDSFLLRRIVGASPVPRTKSCGKTRQMVCERIYAKYLYPYWTHSSLHDAQGRAEQKQNYTGKVEVSQV